MYYKKLEGKRIYLSPMNVEDAEKYVKWMNDRKVTDGIASTAKLINTISEKAWIEKIMERGAFTFSIVLKENDELVGNCGIMDFDAIHGTGTLGIFIGEEEYRSNGYGAETIELLLDFAFNQLRCHNIDLGVFDFNERAIACYKKVGFKEYGRRHECYFLDGKWHDAIKMEVTEQDYRNTRLERA